MYSRHFAGMLWPSSADDVAGESAGDTPEVTAWPQKATERCASLEKVRKNVSVSIPDEGRRFVSSSSPESQRCSLERG
eukprot:scaffold79_cov259-Pinguiococcus_pyrenoidosus.AAC.15